MISKKYIKGLELTGDTLEDMFEYIVTSYTVGAINQAREFVKQLSEQQFISFLSWFASECRNNVGMVITPYIIMRY